jgi:P27 family predicted phage terminase small subunit
MPKARGAKPQPELRLLTGTAERTPRRSPTPAQRPPQAPSWLSAAQRAIWSRTVKELEAAGIGAYAADRDLIVAYVAAVDAMESAARILAKEGVCVIGVNGQKVRHPASIVFAQSARLVDSMSASLGLSPDSRSRITHPRPLRLNAHRCDTASGNRCHTRLSARGVVAHRVGSTHDQAPINRLCLQWTGHRRW